MTTGNNPRSTPDSDEWLAVADVVELLGISRRTVYRYVELGHLPKRSLPGRGIRFARADVLALLKEPRASA
jgi:excisionase family DNA binding protein